MYSGKQVCQWKSIPIFLGITQLQWTCEFQSTFMCSGVVVDRDGLSYTGLTTGHCFDWDEMADECYYMSDSVSAHPVLHKISVIKFEDNDKYDYGLFSFNSLREFPTLNVTKEFPILGSKVLNVSFSGGITKQVSEGMVVSDQVGQDEALRYKVARGRYLVQIPAGPGGSGSPVVNAEGKVVGLVEAIFPETTMATVVIPVGSNLVDFMDDDSVGLKPQPEGPTPEVKKPAPPPPPPTIWQLIKQLFKRIFLFWKK